MSGTRAREDNRERKTRNVEKEGESKQTNVAIDGHCAVQLNAARPPCAPARARRKEKHTGPHTAATSCSRGRKAEEEKEEKDEGPQCRNRKPISTLADNVYPGAL